MMAGMTHAWGWREIGAPIAALVTLLGCPQPMLSELSFFFFSFSLTANLSGKEGLSCVPASSLSLLLIFLIMF